MAQSGTTEGNPRETMTDEAASATMMFEMRLLLSVTALLTLFISPTELGHVTGIGSTVFIVYVVHSITLYLAARRRRNPLWHGRIVYWIDLCWYALMIYFSGGNDSFFVPFFFFVILIASFQWGFDEGARITLAAALLLAASVLAVNPHTDLVQLLLRITFVLALGYIISYWGGMGVAQRRRLALLRDVSRLSNPRFGVAQTLASLLEQTRAFYQASACILLMQENDSEHWLLRSATSANAGDQPTVSRMSAAAAAPLLAFAPQQKVLYNQRLHARLPWSGDARARTVGGRRWEAIDAAACARLADLFDGRAFISAPLPLRKGRGRIYVVSNAQRFSGSDASFLLQVVSQAFPVIENIELLDRLASDAAFRERQKIARDLHDTAIQPYIGLRHALSALRAGASADNPLLDELDRLIAMTGEVVGDMRNFARHVREDHGRGEPELMTALRRQAKQVREFYGLELALHSAPDLVISDRLAAEVFQIVNEGMSNIRKHTRARAGSVTLSITDGALRIDIENENVRDNASAHADAQPARTDFLPRSIAERAGALGGAVRIERTAAGATRVRVTIPT